MSKHRIDADDPFWVPPTPDPQPEEFCVCADIPDPECPYCPEEDPKLAALWAENDLRLHDCDEGYNPACGFCLLEDDGPNVEAPKPAWHVRAWAWLRAWAKDFGGSAAAGIAVGSAINFHDGTWTWPFTATESGVLCLVLAGLYAVWLGCRR